MPNPRPTKSTAPEETAPKTWTDRWSRFWFAAADPAALAGLRLLFGAYLLVWLGGSFADRHALFGLNGWFDARAFREASTLPEDARPVMGWSPIFVAQGSGAIDAVYFGSMLAIAAFAAGLCVRVTSILTWLAIVSFTANPALGYGGDLLVAVVGFYLMIAHALAGFAKREMLAWPLRPLETARPGSVAANLGIRLLQVHVAIAVLACGSYKLQIGEWWAGDALWFPAFHPETTKLDDILAWRQRSPQFLLSVIGLGTYAVLAWQLAFPFLIWRRRWQPFMIAGAIAGMFGCWFIYRLPTYGPVLTLCCLAYLEPSIWRGWLEKMPGLARKQMKSERRTDGKLDDQALVEHAMAGVVDA